ncbi:MAG: Glu/Leu/Phe/Val family dehydrogenase [Candidatus Omnitrophota bacterium]
MSIEIFELMKTHNQEQLAFYSDKELKLRAILAIHSTALGPAIGGIRVYKYDSFDAALYELARLSKGMTYKTSAAGINLGGGYIVVIEQHGLEKNEAVFRSIGRFIQSLNGRFIAAEDIGVTDEYMEYMAMETKHMTGFPFSVSGINGHSQNCAYGVSIGLQAAAQYKWKSGNLSGKKIIIQGYGRVGSRLAQLVKTLGAEVVVADINREKVTQAKKDGFTTIPADKVFTEKCHILSPCAVGPVISTEEKQEFQCEIIAGSANNQLSADDADSLLKEKGILYVPDFIVNAGASINISEERLGGFYKKEEVIRKTEKIHDRLLEILHYADKHDLSPNQAAIQYALKRIESIKGLKGVHINVAKS